MIIQLNRILVILNLFLVIVAWLLLFSVFAPPFEFVPFLSAWNLFSL